MVVGVINTDGTMTREDTLLRRQYERSDQPYLWGGRRPAVWFAVCDAYPDESDRADHN